MLRMGSTMPVTDAVSSVSGRNSRASNVSGMIAASRSIRAQANPNDSLVSAGVLSMLKTTTDTGDLGRLSCNSSRLPAMPRATHQKRGHPKASASKHYHAGSQISGVSSSRDWETLSNQRRGSLTSMQSMPPALPPVHLGRDAIQMPPRLADPASEMRSYSMTSALPTQSLPRHRSAVSLKSQGHEPSLLLPQSSSRPRPPPPPPPMQENRPPYVYPTRLKRPGYRSPSPALSDTYAQAPQPPVPIPSGVRRMPMLPRPPPPQSYNSDYGVDYHSDMRHPHMRPPPRAMSNSPIMGYSDAPQPTHFPYRNPMAMRSAPGLSMSPPLPMEHHLHSQGPHGLPPLQRPPPPGAHVYGNPGAMSRPPFAGHAYLPRPAYPTYPPAPYAGYRPGPPPPPPPNVAPMAHQMFHSAARLARHLPQRTDTPMTDLNPPSSDPPSSGTAPTSSSPPSPRDYTTIQVAVDPVFIEPALVDLQDSSSEPVLAHQYLRYAEGLEKDIDDSKIEVAHPSVPPSGFVQRVKAMLESKAAAELPMHMEFEREKVSPIPPPQDDIACIEYGHEYEIQVHELAANETPRVTLIEEYDAPIELPASPVRLPELPGSPVQQKRRITRELVKAQLAVSSVDDTTAHHDIDDSVSIAEIISYRTRHSCDTGKYTASTTDTKRGSAGEPSTPAHAQTKGYQDASNTPSSPALGLSAVDYTTKVDNTTSDDTSSGDPFVLDADTITLQQQRNKVEADKAQLSADASATKAQADQPVSPLLTGEDLSRYSAVSPLHTQTLGIDETLHASSEHTESGSTVSDTQAGASETSAPPPTPKTPKTYSKSVQLQPNPAFDDSNTPSTNRFSLPPDLSAFSESAMNDSTDMITDVAVRFSLPQITITVSKPHIVEIPPTSSPEREKTAQNALKSSLHATDSREKRGSVTFADEIAPLKINKKPEQYQAFQRTADPWVSNGRPAVRRVSTLRDSKEGFRDSTTELRDVNGIGNRFESTHLPGVKEESVEEMSVSEKHHSETTNGFQFPLPARIAAVKAMQERRLQETAEKARARRAHRQPNRSLAETRDLPSLNFSRMDLIDKLNEALEIRSTKSMDLIRRREFSAIYCPSPQRPQSTEPLRERYMSFFSKPEDFSSFLNADEEDDDQIETPAEHDVPVVGVQPSTEIELEQSESRPLSPEDFLNFASQVNRLSVPSVAGLSDRLSEILPDLRELQLDSVLANFAHANDGIHRFGDGIRPETALSTRTSAGFRTLAERAEEFIKNGTHDSTVPIARVLAGALPESMSADKVSAVNSLEGKQSCLTGSVSAPSELGKDASRPASAFARQRSPANEEEVQALLPPEMNPITRSAQRALLVSTGSSRPWNQDENYPWAGTKLDVDLTVPCEAHARNSMASEFLRKRKTKSLELTTSSEITRGIDIGSLYEHNPTASPTSEQLTGVSIQLPKQSKVSVIGSLTKKFGIGGRGGDGNTTRSIPTPSDIGRSASTLPHRPGERYPTSSLTPPAAFNLDEVRSFFSDDSSDKERNASFRKRLTKLKSKKSLRMEAQRSHSRHSINEDTTYDGGLISIERAGATSSAQTIDGIGMGKTEFRIKRFGEKLRLLMAKGGELIRSLSQRSRVARTGEERVREDWLSDSLYSGV